MEEIRANGNILENVVIQSPKLFTNPKSVEDSQSIAPEGDAIARRS